LNVSIESESIHLVGTTDEPRAVNTLKPQFLGADFNNPSLVWGYSGLAFLSDPVALLPFSDKENHETEATLPPELLSTKYSKGYRIRREGGLVGYLRDMVVDCESWDVVELKARAPYTWWSLDDYLPAWAVSEINIERRTIVLDLM